MLSRKLLHKSFITRVCTVASLVSLALVGCNSSSILSTQPAQSSLNSGPGLLNKPVTVSNQENFVTPYQVDGNLLKRMTLTVSIDKDYAGLSVYADDKLILDDLNIPKSGKNTLNALVKFDAQGTTRLKFVGRSGKVTLQSLQFSDVADLTVPDFQDISNQIGLVTEETYKYGGPSIGDVNNDGHYDFVLNNHNHIPTQLVTNDGQGKVNIERLFPGPQDFHGSALGDYDADGDLDIMVALGGANGTNPSSYALLNNHNGKFTNVSVAAGITTPARGRAPRWVDLDLDGKLDLALFNAKTPNYSGPQQLFYHNNGDGTFTQVRIPGLENAMAERVLVTDIDGDGKQDFVCYSPLSVWKNNGNLDFSNVTNEWLPKSAAGRDGVIAVTDFDANNDGLTDLYLARGKTHYQLSRKSIDFNPETKKLDIRDDGETGTTAIRFEADDAITLSHMELTYRQYNDGFAIFLGENKARHIVKAKGFQVTQLPEEMKTAEDSLTIAPDNAKGWPGVRDQNGLYLGYMGNGKWQAEWVRNQNIYWTVTFSLTGLNDVEYDWKANNRNEQDILLINTGNKFIDASSEWNLPKGGDHWGVTHADLNNDGWEDLFVYRYGFLRERVADLVLLNTGKGYFENMTSLATKDANDPGHGDMGQAFDFNLDGQVDLLNGSEEEGYWYLYQNTTLDQAVTSGNYVLVDVDYSPIEKVDPYFAKIKVTTSSGKTYTKQVGSAGEVFSQSLIDTVHFGLGTETDIKSIEVTWRNGETVLLDSLKSNAVYSTKNGKSVARVKID
ncbi:CRTAC1 family protein [Pseudomaricurvus alcaniphilus]|nr:CRTAC1 family protein [Pseudomaricurvus alcaniphilus]